MKLKGFLIIGRAIAVIAMFMYAQEGKSVQVTGDKDAVSKVIV